MKKATVIIPIIALVSVVSWYGLTNMFDHKKDENTPQEVFNNGMEDHLFGKEMYLSAKVDTFATLEEMEKIADEIVIAEKVAQEEPTILYGAEGRISVAYTLSHFQVKKTIATKNLHEGDSFTMLENEAYDKKQDVTYHIAGYNLIEENQEYLLFLRQSETDPYYIVAGVNYGKVHLEKQQTDYPKGLRGAKTEVGIGLLAEYERQEEVREEIKIKYAQFFQ
jgi:hypothetical protein